MVLRIITQLETWNKKQRCIYSLRVRIVRYILCLKTFRKENSNLLFLDTAYSSITTSSHKSSSTEYRIRENNLWSINIGSPYITGMNIRNYIIYFFHSPSTLQSLQNLLWSADLTTMEWWWEKVEHTCTIFTTHGPFSFLHPLITQNP